jgi:HAD superfamily hydrolase (TIGR01509 family)
VSLSPPYQAVIFDLDGVLTFTEPLIFQIHKDLLRGYGVELTDQDFQALMGLDYADSAAYILRNYPVEETATRLEEKMVSSVLSQIEPMLEPTLGAAELVEFLIQNDAVLGLASNSPCDYVHSVLRGIGLAKHFPFPVCREEVIKGKPAPDPYLEACRRAAASPSRSLAIEDSPVGMQSALTAGMSCCLVGPEEIGILPHGVRHFTSLAGLLNDFQEGKWI